MTLEVEVDRMPPSASTVLDRPFLGRTEPRNGVDDVRIPKLAVDRPGAVLSLEEERPPGDDLRVGDRNMRP
jgi:hypothetical protein